MEIEQNIAKKHNVKINYGESVEVSGIVCALEYDETLLSFKLADNILIIHGRDFDVQTLDMEKGLAVVLGSVSSLEYSKKSEKQGFLKRLIK